MSKVVIYDPAGRPVDLNRYRSRLSGQAKMLMAGFNGASSSGGLSAWDFLPEDINAILRRDLRALRARSRDLARNDDTAKRFLNIIKQNVLGYNGIRLQAKLKVGGELDRDLNELVEVEWQGFGEKRRRGGSSQSPSSCGKLSLRQVAWLALWTRAIDGECFIQILRGYPHNKHRFAVRFINADLLDSSFRKDPKRGNRVEMGIEVDQFDRPVAYHFNKTATGATKKKKRQRVPAEQIIHIYRQEYVGQMRGIPDFAAIMHKAKMLNGVHEAIVVGWRVAAAKMGFFTAANPDFLFDDDGDELDTENKIKSGGFNTLNAIPGSIDMIPSGLDFKTFDPEYPTSTYESGDTVFMRQLSNGLNVSSPTLSNKYDKVNYSSLRQATLEDREAWRCMQAEMIDDFYQPLFDDWFEWQTEVTGRIKLPAALAGADPTVIWMPRGWHWVDPLKDMKASQAAVDMKVRTRQSIIGEISGADYRETIDEWADEEQYLREKGLLKSEEKQEVGHE